jgi:MoxR-like ATPase
LVRVLGCSFARIQFTSDLLPADLVYHHKEGCFFFRPGPIFFLPIAFHRLIPKEDSSFSAREILLREILNKIPLAA